MRKDFEIKEHYQIQDLLQIMRILRGDDGCPWDREQDHDTIRKNMIEETYEVVEAIDRKDSDMLCEELGDVLLQVVFHARMEEEAGGFNFDDVCDGICQKLILRHPHIFGDVVAKTSEQVLNNWDEIKKKEKGQKTATDTLRSVPAVLPALMRAEKVQHRAAKTGFDYPDPAGAFADLKSEVVELEEALQGQNAAHIQEELGDVLFSVVNVSRKLHIDPEEALTRSTEKFMDRFDKVERIATNRGVRMSDSSLDELNALWAQAKEDTK
jgi:tetrapyrrole methylase family protein/MazG family protein